MSDTFVNICPNRPTICLLRYLDVHVGTPDVEESFNVSRPVSPHEVIIIFFHKIASRSVLNHQGSTVLSPSFIFRGHQKREYKL